MVEVSGGEGVWEKNSALFTFLIVIAILIVLIIIGVFIYMKFLKPDTESDERAKQEEYERVYGRKGKSSQKQKAKLDKDTQDFFHSDKYKSRKSQETIKDDYERLYGDKTRNKRKGELPPSSRHSQHQNQLEEGDRKALPPARRERPARREMPAKPPRGHSGPSHERSGKAGKPTKSDRKGRKSE